MNKNTYSNKDNAIFIFFIILFLLISYGWSLVTQWREDQSLNILLSLFYSIDQTPVGLLSSKGIYNPNGMLLFGKIFSGVKNLTTISFILHLIQFISIGYLCRSIFHNDKKWKIAWIFLIFLLSLRATAGEFWNNWILISFNSLFIGSIFSYLRSPKLIYLPLWAFCIFITPALYLAGLLNAVAYSIVILMAFIFKRPKISKVDTTLGLTLTVLVTSFLTYYIWVPFFTTVPISKLASVSNTPTLVKIGNFLLGILLLPKTIFWHIIHRGHKFTFHHAVQFIGFWAKQIEFLIDILMKGLTIYFTFKYFKNFKLLFYKHQKILILFVFNLSIILLSPLLGGPSFAKAERAEMLFQVLPSTLILFYLMMEKSKPSQKLKSITNRILLTIFLLSIISNVVTIKSSLDYVGPVSDADVPTKYKEEVIEEIISRSQNELHINFDVDGLWSSLPQMNKASIPGFPEPYRVGVFFDVLLKMRKISYETFDTSCLQRAQSFYVIRYKEDSTYDCPNYKSEAISIGNYKILEFKK